MDTYMKCSRQYIEHFNSTFAYVLAPGFIEWAINMQINNDPSNISYASNSSNSITKIVREKM